MSDFVLVPGFWLGGWAWSQVADRLRAYGHRAFPVTLTGVGERAHLAGPGVTLETHVQDILHVITYHELDQVVLVGHSGAGMPVSMVADQAPERLCRVVYVESGPLPAGVSQADLTGERDHLVARAECEPEGWLLPFPSWHELGGPDGMFLSGLDERTRARMERLATAHPVRAATDPVRYRVTDGPGPVPRALITCSFPANQVRDLLADRDPMFAGFLGEPPAVLEVPTGHWPMFSEPVALADTLIAAASGADAGAATTGVGFGELFPMLLSSRPERLWSFYRSVFDGHEVYRFPQHAPDETTEYVALRVGISSLGIGRMPVDAESEAEPTASGEPEGGPRSVTGEPPATDEEPRTEEYRRFALWLYVTDCAAVIERARAVGASVVAEPVEQPWGEKVAVLADPAGNEVYLGQEL